MRMKAGAIAAGALLALTVSSDSQAEINGLNCIDVPAQSDVRVSIPFAEDALGEYTVTGTTADGLQVAGPLEVDEFATTYYVRMTSGTAEGRWATIDSNSPTEIDLADLAFLGDVSVGDTFEVYKHQTLGSAFPDDHKGFSFTERPLFFQASTEIQIPSTDDGINKGAGATYYYFNGAWRQAGQPLTQEFGGDILPPQSHFVLRNRDDRELAFCGAGVVESGPKVTELSVKAVDNDLYVANSLPAPRTLASLNLGGTPAFETTALFFNVEDQLLVIDNTSTGINKSADATYFYYNGAWRKSGAPLTDSFDTEVLPAGSHIILRKQAGTPGTVLWEQPSPF